MHYEASKQLIEYKTDINILREQIRTMNLKLEEVVNEAYKNLSPEIISARAMLAVEMQRANGENATLRVQVESLMQERAQQDVQIARYFQRLETLEDLIGS